MSDILDYKLQHWLKKYIRTLPYNERIQLKNIYHCNERTLADHPVFLLSNGKNALYFGQATCKNTFACPCCTARIMSKYRSKIASAIDALKSEYYPFMVTFAIPHLKFMSCKETTDILYNTWRKAFFSKSVKRGRYVNVVNKFWLQSEVKYYVRCSEYTWGENGWNPHFHVLFFVPRKYKSSVYNFESDIEQFWMDRAEKETIAYWKKHNLHGDAETQQKLLQRVFWAKNAGHSVKFSRHESTSADYLTGWSGDKELTKTEYKTAHAGHFNPYEILTNAAKGDEFFAELYHEFMINVTRKPVHRRAEFSKGLHQIITTYRNTEGFKEAILKKKQTANWEVVCWFSAESWQKLCELNYEQPILAQILELAVENPTAIFDVLENHGISVEFSKHIWTESIEAHLNHA